ncbi:MAG: hypothetical protein N3B12_07535, partial [Armatimonadetes bacterium]|nr:hypothetical protein [Armatimonadota bacterium]
PAEFAGRIEYLIEHEKERLEMGSRAKENAANFSIERMANDFERLYRSVIESKQPAVATVA